jgi:hypothetical protein
MAQSPEEVRQEIADTRENLSRDVDALAEKVSPGRIMQRRMDRTKGRLRSLKDRVMGDDSSSTQRSGVSVGATVSDAADTVARAPALARQQTEGNPLAAGLIAFAGGWLISSLLPPSRAEQQAAQAVQDKAADLAEPIKTELSEVATEMRDNLQPSAQEAVQSVQETATNAAAAVKDETSSAADSVKDDTKKSAQQIRETR